MLLPLLSCQHPVFALCISLLVYFALPSNASGSSESENLTPFLTGGIRYDYMQQIDARQILAEVYPFYTHNKFTSYFTRSHWQSSILALSCGVRTASDKRTIPWRFQMVDNIWKKTLWHPPRSKEEEEEEFPFAIEIPPQIKLADVGGITLLDFNRTGTAEIMDHMVRYSRGLSLSYRSKKLNDDNGSLWFAQHITFAEISIVPTVGLTTYRLGAFYSNHFGPDADKGYSGVSADIKGTARFSFDNQELSLDAASRHVIAGRSVHFLTFGATASFLLPVLGDKSPGIQIYLRGERELTYFGGREIGTNVFSVGLRVPVTPFYFRLLRYVSF